MFNYDYGQIDDYINEDRMYDFLRNFMPTVDIIRDRTVPNSNSRMRPDFRIDELNLIIEFDGFQHYTDPQKFINDNKKYELYTNMGYTVKSIPYFVQLSAEVICWIFDDHSDKIDFDKIKDYTTFKHGFIDSKCPLPSMFCSIGSLKCMKEMLFFDGITNTYISESLLTKIIEKESIVSVVDFEIQFIDLCSWFFMGSIFGSHPEISFDLYDKLLDEFLTLSDFYGKKHFYVDLWSVENEVLPLNIDENKMFLDQLHVDEVFDYLNVNNIISSDDIQEIKMKLIELKREKMEKYNTFFEVHESCFE